MIIDIMTEIGNIEDKEANMNFQKVSVHPEKIDMIKRNLLKRNLQI